MPLIYGVPTNYPSPMIPIPSNMQAEPVEGRMQIPVEILWGSMGGTGRVVEFNVAENLTHDMRQIASLIIDNSECTVPIAIIFPDVGGRIVIPANAKRAAMGVYTNGLRFITQAPTSVVTDVTRMQILNYRIPPLYIP